MTTTIESVTCTDCGHEFAGPLAEIPMAPCSMFESARKTINFSGNFNKLELHDAFPLPDRQIG